ncbi:MAG: hypothetical protein EPO35_03155 [Acidobacteria bacterium]|nr:MAG: hypothetical protein EPO35_03155 [Acidobacteriota bacterium]
MSDRKYSQRGYMDSDREKREPRRGPGNDAPRKPIEKFDPRIPRDPRTPNMMGFKETFRCVRCGHEESPDIGTLSKCSKCGTALRACIQCASFDSSSRFECLEKITARVSPKDESNDCALFTARMKVEKQTHSAPAPPQESRSNGGHSGPSAAARKAFDDLFKK